MFTIGVISDTHGLLRPAAEERLEGVDHIIHAGDIGDPGIIDALRRIAPVTAIRGNIDTAGVAAAYPDRQWADFAGRSIYVLHDVKDLDIDPAASGVDIVISGHSHRAKIETVDGALFLNPGSAGPRRFKLPITVATIELTAQTIRPQIHEIAA